MGSREGLGDSKSFVDLFEKLAERGQLPAKVLREIAKHAPAVVKVAGRAA